MGISSDRGYKYSFDNNSLDYHLIEYSIIKNSMINDFFIFDQPFDKKDILLIKNKYFKFSDEKELKFFLSPGISSNQKGLSPNMYFDINTLLNSNDTYIKFNTVFDKRLVSNESYHGDKHSFLTGYVKEAYFLSNIKNLEIFAGRIGRNFGILNERSMIFSNNPYPFDHYGFALSGTKINFSFYLSRLNDLDNSIDSEGVLIPIDSLATTKRFFSFQNFNLKLSDDLQVGLSQSIVYGGPDASFEGAFINPVNFYYASQRNSLIQMNGFWQLLLCWKYNQNNVFYFDFLVDDFIINNSKGYNDRDLYSDRLGLTLKLSNIDFISKNSLSSITYTMVSNYTYTTFRNFENYTFQNKGIGFPYNSYEALKFNFSKFYNISTIYNLNLILSKKGSTSLFDVYSQGLSSFPINPVKYSFIFSGAISKKFFNNQLDIFYKFSNNMSSFNLNFNGYEVFLNHELRVQYNINF